MTDFLHELPERCYGLPRARMPASCPFPYCHARVYTRVWYDNGIARWRAGELLGPPRRSIVRAKKDGDASGLPFVEGAKQDAIAMTYRDILPAWAMAAYRLGFTDSWIFDDNGRLYLYLDGIVVAKFGPFKGHRGVEMAGNALRTIFRRTSGVPFGETWVGGGLRQGWTGRMPKAQLTGRPKNLNPWNRVKR